MIQDLEYEVSLGASHHVTMCFNYVAEMVNPTSNRVAFRYEKADYDGMRDYLGQTNSDEIMTKPTSDECWDEFQKHLLEAMAKFVTQQQASSDSMAKRKKSQWMNAKARQSINLKKAEYK